jgi:hypothetical protein
VSSTPIGVIRCGGAPRDLGFDQGRASAAAVRGAVSGLPLAARLGAPLRLAGSALAARAQRDALRHFPRMSERLAGLARGARVPRAALAALQAREIAPGRAPAARGGVALAAAPERTGAGALLARSLGAPLPRWIVRRSAPDHDWPSVEIALPWLVPCLAGVNDGGLAIVVLPLPHGAEAVAACSAPALLLAQDCLQRCDGVQKAIEWCERRPAGGRASLLLADAGGDVAEVAIEGAARRIGRPRDGLLAAGADAAEAAALEKRAAARAEFDVGALCALLAPTGGPPDAAVVLDPAARVLAVAGQRFSARDEA